MKIQQFNPKIISITQLRRDIDVLEKVLAQEDEAWVMRNQSVLFVAVAPEKYRKLRDNGRIKRAITIINKIREDSKKAKRPSVSGFVVKMRDQRVKKWKK